jgi:hypothetical protein
VEAAAAAGAGDELDALAAGAVVDSLLEEADVSDADPDEPPELADEVELSPDDLGLALP